MVKRFFPLFFSLLAFTITTSCRPESAPNALSPQQATSPPTEFIDLPSNEDFSLENIKKQCLASPGARFNHALIHCLCPAAMIFAPGRGCISLSVSPLAQRCREQGFLNLWRQSLGVSSELKECLASLYGELNFAIDSESFAAQDLTKILADLDQNYFQFTTGIARSALPWGKTRVFLTLSPLQDDAPQIFTDLVLRNFRSSPQFGPFEEIPIPSKSSEVFTRDKPGEQANWLLTCSTTLTVYHRQSTLICNLLAEHLQETTAPEAFRSDLARVNAAEKFSELLRYDRRCEQCSLVTSYPRRNSFKLSKKIFFKDQTPIIRYLRLEDREFQINAYLDGSGRISALFFATLHLDKKNDELIAQFRGYSGDWQPVFSRDEAQGSAENLHRALVQLKYQAPANKLLQPDQLSPSLGILLLESGINPLAPGIAPTLAFHPHDLAKLQDNYSLAHFLNDLRLPLGLDFPGFSPKERLLYLFDSKLFEPATAHGTKVASLVLSGLHHPRLYLIPPQQLPPQPEQLANYIRQRGIKIVNISQMFERSDFQTRRCRDYFRELYQKLPEVVFVAAAGNTGTLDPDICPGRSNLLDHVPNAITIAGSEGPFLHHSSSYGQLTAHGAVAFVQSCYGGTAQADNKQLAERQVCAGTSFAAAKVSNAIAHFIATHHEISGAEIVRVLLNTCSDQGLAVSCGGIFDLSLLEP